MKENGRDVRRRGDRNACAEAPRKEEEREEKEEEEEEKEGRDIFDRVMGGRVMCVREREREREKKREGERERKREKVGEREKRRTITHV
mgnify:CR=1 FL=1